MQVERAEIRRISQFVFRATTGDRCDASRSRSTHAPRSGRNCGVECSSYHRPWLGGRVKGAVCQIVAKSDQVRLDFIHGTSLFDPQKLLKGDRKAKRFIPIESVAQAKRPAIAMLIRAAAEYDPSKAS